ncbi:MAG: hypothetical protein J6Y43_06975 [Clostridia bacterium]|nr:hypothetical protein [Clostridia bacterium]
MKRGLYLICSFIIFLLAIFTITPFYAAKSEEENLFTDGGLDDGYSAGTLTKTYYLNCWGVMGFSVKKSGNGYYVETSYSEGNDYGLSPNGTVLLDAGVYKLNFDATIVGSADICFKEVNDIFVEETVAEQGEFHTYEFTFTVEESGNYKLTLFVSNFTTVSIDNLGLYYLGEIPTERDAETFDGENITTETGASIRAHGTTSGLRFKGRVNKAFFDGLIAAYPDAQAGMIIAPTDFLSDCEFTVSALTAYKSVQICAVSGWNNEQTADTDNYYGFNCALVNLKPYNVDRRFSARSFVRFTENGNMKYIYGDYAEAFNARSIKYVAEEALKEAELYADYQITAMHYFLDTVYYPEAVSVSGADGTFELRYSGINGYFVLDYDRQAYTVSVNSFKVNGAETDFSQGMVLISESADIEISFGVYQSGETDVCPVRGKIYRIG